MTVLYQIEIADSTIADVQIISDQQVILSDGVYHVTERFRLVTTFMKGKKLLRIVTNRFDVSPNKVADMYPAHWHVEFFLI